MDTQIRDFCKNYKEKLKNDKDIKDNDLDPFNDFRPRIYFNVKMTVSYARCYDHEGQTLFNLDQEDLEYLYNKYSKRIESEMEQNIEKVKDSYKDVI